MMPAICARTAGRRVPPVRFPRLRSLRPRSRHPRRQSPQRPALPPRSLSVRLPPSILQHHRWAVLRGLSVPRPSRHIRLFPLPRRSLPPCPFRNLHRLLRQGRRLRQCRSPRLRQCHIRRLRQCRSPRRNSWRMLQLLRGSCAYACRSSYG